MGNLSKYETDGKNNKWFHVNQLTIIGDSVYMSSSPIYINKNKDTVHSASDGGFYSYEGTIKKTNSKRFTIELLQKSCDYCGELTSKKEDGSYKKTSIMLILNCEWIDDNTFMASETIKYDNKTLKSPIKTTKYQRYQ